MNQQVRSVLGEPTLGIGIATLALVGAFGAPTVRRLRSGEEKS